MKKIFGLILLSLLVGCVLPKLPPFPPPTPTPPPVVVPPTPPPTPVPPPTPEPPPPTNLTIRQTVSGVLVEESGCGIGACVVQEDWKKFVLAVMASLEKKGLVVRYDAAHGEAEGFASEAEVSKDGVAWEAYQFLTTAHKTRDVILSTGSGMDGSTRLELETLWFPKVVDCPLPLGPLNYLTVDVEEQMTAFGRATNATFSWCEDGDPLPPNPHGYTGPCRTRCCGLGVDAGPQGVACEKAIIGIPRWYSKVDPSPKAVWQTLKDREGNPVNPFLAEPGAFRRAYACPHLETAPVRAGNGLVWPHGDALDCTI